MALQNRVTPHGSIVADPARGLLMGNRGGQLHDDHRRLTRRRWVSRQWIACALTYKDRHETIMAPGRYTQLFFLDEATAFSAGHRPCALCRRADFLRFMGLWQKLRGMATQPKVAEVDAMLHAERVGLGREKVSYVAKLGELPEGVMVAPTDGSAFHPIACLYHGSHLLPWSPSGYEQASPASPSLEVRVLTPASIVAIFAAGYAPMLHPSAWLMSAARST